MSTWVAQGITGTVANTSDSGVGSFRDAIQQINASSDASNVTNFDIPGATPHVIFQTSIDGWPAITNQVLIDGYSEPDYARSPVVVLQYLPGAGEEGLKIQGNGSIVQGLQIADFEDSFVCCGISLNADNCVVEGCHIFSNGTGISVLGNVNVIGGTNGNIVSGNPNTGIELISSSNDVLGNYIGTDITGTTSGGSQAAGIGLSSLSSHNTIGGTSEWMRNIISGNSIGIRA